MFVDASDYDVLPYNIPNLNSLSDQFSAYVDEQEEIILKRLLGYQLYTEFVAGIAATPLANKWKNLRDGAEYTYLDVTYRWDGMKALLKPFIYSVWLRDTFDSHSGGGIIISGPENAEVISPNTRIVRAWNQYCMKAGASSRYNGYLDWFDDFEVDNLYGIAMRNTLFGFLYANSSDYTTLAFSPPNTQNFFDL